MFRFRLPSPTVAAIMASGSVAIYPTLSRKRGSIILNCDNNDSAPPRREDLRVVLSAASLERVRSLAHKMGRPGYTAQFVAVRPAVTQREVMDYDELFARRVAFRVKGLAFGEGFVSAIGRLSVMEGEVLTKDFVASMPIISPELSDSKDTWELATYAPTSLKAQSALNKPWSGVVKVPESNKELSMTYVPLSAEEEVLVGGVLWMQSLVDAEGKCAYQGEWRAKYPDIEPDLNRVTVKSPEARDVDVSATNCSVCRWLMSGPCHEEYEAWDKAMEAFNADAESKEKEHHFMASSTKMAACVRKHEYYDVYVAFL